MKAIAVKNTFNAKESLKNQGFVYDPSTKTWSKDFASQAEFDEFYSNFTSASYSGRRQSKFNSAVVFEFVENEPEVSESVKVDSNTSDSETIVIPSEEEVVRMIKAGEIKDFHFSLGRYKTVLDGYVMYMEEGGNTIDIREAGKISAEHEKNLSMIINQTAKAYITRLHNNQQYYFKQS